MKISFSYDCEGNWGFLDWPELPFDGRDPRELEVAYQDILALHEGSQVPASYAFVAMFGLNPEARSSVLANEAKPLTKHFDSTRCTGGFWDGKACLDSVIAAGPIARVASHSLTHLPATSLAASDALLEFQLSKDLLETESGESDIEFVFPRNLFAHLDVCQNVYRSFRPTPANRRAVAAFELAQSTLGREVPRKTTSDFVFWQGGARSRLTDRGWRQLWLRRFAADHQNPDRQIHVWSHPHNAITDPNYLDRLEWLLKLMNEHRSSISFTDLGGDSWAARP